MFKTKTNCIPCVVHYYNNVRFFFYLCLAKLSILAITREYNYSLYINCSRHYGNLKSGFIHPRHVVCAAIEVKYTYIIHIHCICILSDTTGIQNPLPTTADPHIGCGLPWNLSIARDRDWCQRVQRKSASNPVCCVRGRPGRQVALLTGLDRHLL